MNKLQLRVAFLTLGCKVNSYETEAMEKLFREAGYEQVDFTEQADVYVVNTCTVTNVADKKSRQMLHRAKKVNPDGIVVAAGCYVQATQCSLEEDAGVDLLVGNSQKGRVVELVEAFRQSRNASKSLELADRYEPLSIDQVMERTRANIKIQDGCNQFCSYCIIPYVRGRIRSREEHEILAEIKKLAEKGYQEVVLTGIHLSSYGKDIDDKSHLLELLKQIQAMDGIRRIRLGSLEPRIITDDFVKELAFLDKICPHFHLSLQSGCDATLHRMNRHYSTKEYQEACLLLRQSFWNPAITTDVIVGFPGETEEEFELTQDFLQRIGFSSIHIFPYSRRKGTRADQMEGQIPESMKKERAARLAELEKRMSEEYLAHFISREEWVLFEDDMEICGKRHQVGHTMRYVKVAVESKEILSGQIWKVRDLKQAGSKLMLGSLASCKC